MPLANGRSLNLEVERSRLICPPRTPAIMITDVQGHSPRTRKQHREVPFGTHVDAVPQLGSRLSVFPALPSFAAAPSSPWRPRGGYPLLQDWPLRLGPRPASPTSRSCCLHPLTDVLGRVRRECVCVASPWAGTACLPLAMRMLALGRGKEPSSVCFWRCYSCQSNLRE